MHGLDGRGIDWKGIKSVGPGWSFAKENPRVVVTLEAGLEMAAASEQVRAAGQADAIRRVVAVGGHTALQIDLEAVEFAVRHEVDHTGDRVRAIDRRSAAGDDVDPLQQHLRQRLYIAQPAAAAGPHSTPLKP